jgi:hypothetical protein
MTTNTATQAEQEKLIQTLKFTPRTYKIRLWGYGGEYVMGTVDRKIYDYFKSRRLDLSDFAWNDEYAEDHKIPESMYPFYPSGWHECDDMGHAWGVDRAAGTLQVEDENDNVVFEKKLDDIDGYSDDSPEWGGGDEIWVDMKPAGTVVFVGASNEKGTFFEGSIELTDPFDPTKICLCYDDIDSNEIITRVEYDGVEIDNWGGDTSGKSSDFGFYIAGSNKQDGKGYTKYRNMDDIDYGLTEWFPAKVKPVRPGQYNTKTKDGYTYQSRWTGKWWEQTWGDPPKEVKIKEWQGIAYDPDEQFLRDELEQIVADFPSFPTADEIDELEHIHCTSCDWKGHEKECNNWDGQVCCPECGDPVDFTN